LGEGETSNKHAILTIYHSIELFLKEYLFRINPLLIYKNIDAKITEDSMTVGINDIITRLDNLKLGLPKDEQDIIKKIQKRRNRIEHHRYEKEDNDEFIIGEALKLVQYFVEGPLNEKLHQQIPADVLNQIEKAIYNYRDLEAIAESRFHDFLWKVFPEWDPNKEDLPEPFPGTHECPICDTYFLVTEFIAKPFCFYCNKQIDAKVCEDCGIVHLTAEKCPYCINFDES
jgi:hypothetical protein